MANLNSIQFSPEGHNLLDTDGATRYLSDIHGRDIPKPKFYTDLETDYHIAWAEMGELRRAVMPGETAPDSDTVYKRRQNDAEHAKATSDISTIFVDHHNLSETYDSDISIPMIALIANRHDRLEVYCGDTPITHAAKLLTKAYREQAAITLQAAASEHTPTLAQIDASYILLATENDRIVYGMDAVEAIKHTQYTECALQRHYKDDFRKVTRKMLRKAVYSAPVFELAKREMLIVAEMWSDYGGVSDTKDLPSVIDELSEEISSQHFKQMGHDGVIKRGGKMLTELKAQPVVHLNTFGRVSRKPAPIKPEQPTPPNNDPGTIVLPIAA